MLLQSPRPEKTTTKFLKSPPMLCTDSLAENGLSEGSIEEAFLKADEDFMNVIRTAFVQSPHLATVGSCALVAVLTSNSTLYVAGLGDCRAVLGTGSSGRLKAVQVRIYSGRPWCGTNQLVWYKKIRAEKKRVDRMSTESSADVQDSWRPWNFPASESLSQTPSCMLLFRTIAGPVLVLGVRVAYWQSMCR
jgi:hypothetical protein